MTDEKERDINNTTLAILLILTIMVTLIGTWLILDALHASASPGGFEKPETEAKVSLTIIEPPVSDTAATVGLVIKKIDTGG